MYLDLFTLTLNSFILLIKSSKAKKKTKRGTIITQKKVISILDILHKSNEKIPSQVTVFHIVTILNL